MSEVNLGRYYHQQWYWQHQSSGPVHWKWFPAWATFFLDLGAAVASLRTASNKNFTLAVTVPTGAMAAPLVTAGAILESWSLSGDNTPEEHLAKLKALPEGTTVTYRSPKSSTIEWGQLNGFSDGMFHLTIEQNLKKATTSSVNVPVNLAMNIQLANRQLENVPIRKRKRPIANPTGLKSLITKHESSDFIVPQLRCTLISKTSKMEEELTGLKVSLVSDSELAEGRLQDLVKLDKFTESNRYEPYTTQFISVDSKPTLNPNLTPIAVFDGCRAYLSRSSSWEDSTRIVIADRCEYAFLDLISIINGDLVYGKEPINLNLPNGIPEGIELVGYMQ